jgi:hypothetical protein
LAYAIVCRDFKFLKDKAFYWGLGLFMLIVAPWHIWETVKHGKSFWDNYLLYQIFTRYSTGIENNGAPFWTYLDIFTANPLLATLTAASAIYSLVKSFSDRRFALPLLACLIIFLVFSISATKRYNYLLIIYPFLCVMIAAVLFNAINYIKLVYLRAASVAVLMALFIFLGVRYEFSKVARVSQNDNNLDNRFVGLWLKQNYPDAQIYTDAWYHAGPALFFYYGRQIPTIPETLLNSSAGPKIGTLLLHRPTRDVIAVKDYIFVTQ